MNAKAATRSGEGLKGIMKGEIHRHCFKHLAVETPDVPLSVRLYARLPRMSRIIDVTIAAVTSYFWLCL